jgi:hypothetical protein
MLVAGVLRRRNFAGVRDEELTYQREADVVLTLQDGRVLDGTYAASGTCSRAHVVRAVAGRRAASSVENERVLRSTAWYRSATTTVPVSVG